ESVKSTKVRDPACSTDGQDDARTAWRFRPFSSGFAGGRTARENKEHNEYKTEAAMAHRQIPRKVRLKGPGRRIPANRRSLQSPGPVTRYPTMAKPEAPRGRAAPLVASNCRDRRDYCSGEERGERRFRQGVRRRRDRSDGVRSC